MSIPQQTAPLPPRWNRSGDHHLQALLLYVIQQLVDVPTQVAVNITEGQRTVILTVTVAPSDVGKVLGKQGRIADALRTILTAAAAKQRKRAVLEIIA